MGIKSGMIANELQLVQEVLSGKKDIPEYFTIKEFSLKMFRYFYYDLEYSIEESCKEICNFLESKDILYSKKEVYAIPTWYDTEKGRPLRASNKPITYYKSEIDLIKKLSSRQVQRLAFGFLTLVKFQQQYTKISEPTAIYRGIREVLQLVNISAGSKRTDAFVIELGKLGYISAPFNKNCIYCNIASDASDEVMLEVYNFEPNMIDSLFETLFGKNEIIVMAIPQCEEEADEYIVDTLPNMKRRFGMSIGDSSITKACTFSNRVKTKGYMFFKVEEEDEPEFLQWIVQVYINYIQVNYRKMKKDGSLDKAREFFNSDLCREYFKNKQQD